MHNTTCDFSKFFHKMTTSVHTNVKPNPYINILSVFNLHLFIPCNKSYYFRNDIWTQKENHWKTGTNKYTETFTMILWSKNSVQHFLWMNESRNPNSTVWQMMPKLLCFKDAKSPIICFLFLVLFVVLQVIVEWFWWVGFSDGTRSCFAIDNIYGECESRFLETIDVELSKERRDVDKKKLYEARWGGGRGKDFSFGSGKN